MPSGCGEIARGGVDGVLGVPGVGDPVAARVDSPAEPGVGHELHPADRAGRARAHVPAEVGLDLVDRSEHLPRDPVGVACAQPEGVQLLVRELGSSAGTARRRPRAAAAARLPRWGSPPRGASTGRRAPPGTTANVSAGASGTTAHVSARPCRPRARPRAVQRRARCASGPGGADDTQRGNVCFLRLRPRPGPAPARRRRSAA